MEREITAFLANGLPERFPREGPQGGLRGRGLREDSQGGLLWEPRIKRTERSSEILDKNP